MDLGGVWDALVIDDYYCLSAEKINAPVAEPVAHGALDTARQAYSIEGLLGSAEKDVDACTSLKAAGAEIRSGEKKARSGVVPVGAPLWEKNRTCSCLAWDHRGLNLQIGWKLGFRAPVPKMFLNLN